MNYGLSRIHILFLATAALLLSGCSTTTPARFYTLTPLAPQQEGKPAGDAKKVSVNIAPVELPDPLNRLQIVTREGSNELKLAEFDRWGGSLAENIAVVIGENLSQLLGSDQVFGYLRAQSTAPDYTVALRVLQLDCAPGEQVKLKVQWTILAGPARKEGVTRITAYTEKSADRQYAAMVTGISRMLEQLSRDIAREIAAGPAQR